MGMINHEFKWMRIRATSNVGLEGEDYNILNPAYEQWEDLMKEINAGSPEGMNKAF